MLNEINAAHKMWREENPHVRDYDGSMDFQKMAELVDDLSRYNYHHSIPRILVHGDVVGFMDFFEESQESVRVSMTSMTVKPEACVAAVIMFVEDWLALMKASGAPGPSRFNGEDIAQLSSAMAALWGITSDVLGVDAS